MKAIELSKYIIAKFDNTGDLTTNKKLQKLLFYTEAWSLVYIASLIDEDFEAWIHGPVIPAVYQEYKRFGYSPIKMEYPKGSDSSKFVKNFKAAFDLSTNQIELINEVIGKYGVLTSYELENLSHSEKPWLDARSNIGYFDHCSKVIDKGKMKEYYSSLIAK